MLNHLTEIRIGERTVGQLLNLLLYPRIRDRDRVKEWKLNAFYRLALFFAVLVALPTMPVMVVLHWWGMLVMPAVFLCLMPGVCYLLRRGYLSVGVNVFILVSTVGTAVFMVESRANDAAYVFFFNIVVAGIFAGTAEVFVWACTTTALLACIAATVGDFSIAPAISVMPGAAGTVCSTGQHFLSVVFFIWCGAFLSILFRRYLLELLATVQSEKDSLQTEIDQRQRIEDEKVKLEDQLRHSQKMQAIGQLAGGMAHDFNNLLSGITGLAELLGRDIDEDSPLQKYPRGILAAARKAGNLTEQLLVFARKGKYRAVPVDLHKTIAAAADILNHTIDKRIAVKQHLNASPSTTIGDPSQLENMLLNLAVNARDAMPDGGELLLETAVVDIGERDFVGRPGLEGMAPGRWLVLKVTDTGVGMAPDTMERIFEPFFTTKEAGKGTGLGLSAVYGCVKNHQGYIDVRSEPGRGAVFLVYLPIHVTDKPVDDTGVYDTTVTPTNGARIMLVDDDPTILETVAKLLEGMTYRVRGFEHGLKALEYYRDHSSEVDVSIIDMVMPVMSGTDLVKEMLRINPGARVLIASGYSVEDVTQTILARGTATYIRKPFKVVELAREIEALIAVG